jgi:hypothetical protein
MTGVPAPEPKAYCPWREIAAELASEKDLAKALELAHELNCVLKEQLLGCPEEENPLISGDLTVEGFSPVLPLP